MPLMHSTTTRLQALFSTGQQDEALARAQDFAKTEKDRHAWQLVLRFARALGDDAAAARARLEMAKYDLSAGGKAALKKKVAGLSDWPAARKCAHFSIGDVANAGARAFQHVSRLDEDGQRVCCDEIKSSLTACNDPGDTAFRTALLAYAYFGSGDEAAGFRTALQLHSTREHWAKEDGLTQFTAPLMLIAPHGADEIAAPTNASSTSDPAVSAPLLIIEGDPDPQLAEQLLARVFPNAKTPFISFLARPKGLIDSYKDHFGPAYNGAATFPDILIDYTGNYSRQIESPSALAGFLGTRALRHYFDNAPSPAAKDLLLLYHETLAMAFDDQLYRPMRLIRGLEGLLADKECDGVLVCTKNGASAYLALAMAREKYGREKVFVSAVSPSPAVQHNIQRLANEALNDDVITLPANDDGRDLSHPPSRNTLFFDNEFGPLWDIAQFGKPTPVPADDTVQAAMQRRMTAAQERLSGDRFFQDILRRMNERILEKAVLINITADELKSRRCLLYAVNLTDRIAGRLGAELIVQTGKKRPIILVDYAEKDAPRLAEYHEEWRAAGLEILVINYRHIMQGFDIGVDFAPRNGAILSGELLADDWAQSYSLRIGTQALVTALSRPASNMLTVFIPLHLRLGLAGYLLAGHYNVEGALVFPTRNTYLRAFAQGVRLGGAHSLEIQTVLAGKMFRHRSPNGDRLSVLDQWSKFYYSDYFGYPDVKIINGGSLRYDAMWAQANTQWKSSKALGAAKSEALGTPGAKYVLAATQPMQLQDNLDMLKATLQALDGNTKLTLLVKLHPHEPKSNQQAYQKLCAQFPNVKAVVRRAGDIYPLMIGAELLVAQSSNVLVEAGILGTRAIAFNVGDYLPPVDFGAMGCAVMCYDTDEYIDTIKAALSSARGKFVGDAQQKAFLKNNPALRSGDFYPRMHEIIDALNRFKPVRPIATEPLHIVTKDEESLSFEDRLTNLQTLAAFVTAEKPANRFTTENATLSHLVRLMQNWRRLGSQETKAKIALDRSGGPPRWRKTKHPLYRQYTEISEQKASLDRRLPQLFDQLETSFGAWKNHDWRHTDIHTQADLRLPKTGGTHLIAAAGDLYDAVAAAFAEDVYNAGKPVSSAALVCLEKLEAAVSRLAPLADSTERTLAGRGRERRAISDLRGQPLGIHLRTRLALARYQHFKARHALESAQFVAEMAPVGDKIETNLAKLRARLAAADSRRQACLAAIIKPGGSWTKIWLERLRRAGQLSVSNPKELVRLIRLRMTPPG